MKALFASNGTAEILPCLSHCQIFEVWLFDHATEKWIKVVIDENLPCHKDKDGFPVVTFARPLGNEVAWNFYYFFSRCLKFFLQYIFKHFDPNRRPLAGLTISETDPIF